MIKSVSTALFCIALVFYVLPWHSAAVGDARFGGVTGLHLVAGMAVTEKGLFGIEVKRAVRVEPFAVLSFLAAVGGAAAGFLKLRKVTAWQASAGALAVLLLFLLRSRLVEDAGGIVESEMRVGFHLALLASAGAAALNLYAMFVRRGGGGVRSESGERNAFCPQCGVATEGGDRFCRRCGAPLP
jgi:hypothetical protein